MYLIGINGLNSDYFPPPLTVDVRPDVDVRPVHEPLLNVLQHLPGRPLEGPQLGMAGAVVANHLDEFDKKKVLNSLRRAEAEWPRAGHLRYFLIFLIMKNYNCCIFYRVNLTGGRLFK